MKYVYQQILAFFALILITVSTTGILIIQYVTSNIYDEKRGTALRLCRIDHRSEHDDPTIGKWIYLGFQPGCLVRHLRLPKTAWFIRKQRICIRAESAEDFERLRKAISLTERDRGFLNEKKRFLTVYLPRSMQLRMNSQAS